MRQKPSVASSAKTYTPWYLAGVFYVTRTCLALSFLFATAFLVVNLPQALGALHDALAAYGVSFFVGAFLVDAVLRPSLVFLGACLSWYMDTALKNWQDLVLHQDLLVVPKIQSVPELRTQPKGNLLTVSEILPVEENELVGSSGAVIRHLGLGNKSVVSKNRSAGYTYANCACDQRRKLTSWLSGRGSRCDGNGVPNARIWLSGVAAARSSGALGARQELDVASIHVFGDSKTALPFSFLFRQEQSLRQQGLGQTVSGVFPLSEQVSVQKEGDGLGSYKYEQVNSRSDAAYGSLSGPGAMTNDSNWWVPVLAEFLIDQSLQKRAPFFQSRDVAVPFRNEAPMSEYLQDGDSSSARHTAQSVRYALDMAKWVKRGECVDVVSGASPQEESLDSDPFIHRVVDWVLGESRSPAFFDTEEEEGMQSSNKQDGFTAHTLGDTRVIVPK